MARSKDFRKPIATRLKNRLKKEFNYVGLQITPLPVTRPILSFEIIDTLNPFELPDDRIKEAAISLLHDMHPAESSVNIQLSTKKTKPVLSY